MSVNASVDAMASAISPRTVGTKGALRRLGTGRALSAVLTGDPFVNLQRECTPKLACFKRAERVGGADFPSPNTKRIGLTGPERAWERP